MNQLLDDDSGKRLVCGLRRRQGRGYCGHQQIPPHGLDSEIANYAGLLVDQRPDMKSDGWNSLGDLDPDASGYAEHCEAKAIAMVKPEPNDHNKHFTEAARSGATLAIMREGRRARRKTGRLISVTSASSSCKTQKSCAPTSKRS